LVFFNQLAVQLVMMVAALVGNPFIQPCQTPARLFPVVAARPLAGQLVGQAAAFLLRLALVLRRFDLFSAGQADIIPQSQIKTNRTTNKCRFFDLHFHLNADEVFSLLFEDQFFDPDVHGWHKYLPPILRTKDNRVLAIVDDSSVAVQFVSRHTVILIANICSVSSASNSGRIRS
jgi:hypothetical protein